MLPSCGAPQPRPRPRHSRTATPRVAGGQGRDWVVAGAEAAQRMSRATSSPHPPSAPSRVLISAVKRSIGSTTGCTITEKAPKRAVSWLKVPTSAFTFKTLHH